MRVKYIEFRMKMVSNLNRQVAQEELKGLSRCTRRVIEFNVGREGRSGRSRSCGCRCSARRLARVEHLRRRAVAPIELLNELLEINLAQREHQIRLHLA